MARHLELELITPERVVLREPAEYVSLPSIEGFYGILPGHAPMLGALKTGVLHYRQGGRRRAAAIMGGFFEVHPDRTVVLADEATLPEEIDVAAERAELEGLRRVIDAGGDPEEVAAARQRLERALTRLRVADPGK